MERRLKDRLLHSKFGRIGLALLLTAVTFLPMTAPKVAVAASSPPPPPTSEKTPGSDSQFDTMATSPETNQISGNFKEVTLHDPNGNLYLGDSEVESDMVSEGGNGTVVAASHMKQEGQNGVVTVRLADMLDDQIRQGSQTEISFIPPIEPVVMVVSADNVSARPFCNSAVSGSPDAPSCGFDPQAMIALVNFEGSQIMHVGSDGAKNMVHLPLQMVQKMKGYDYNRYFIQTDDANEASGSHCSLINTETGHLMSITFNTGKNYSTFDVLRSGGNSYIVAGTLGSTSNAQKQVDVFRVNSNGTTTRTATIQGVEGSIKTNGDLLTVQSQRDSQSGSTDLTVMKIAPNGTRIVTSQVSYAGGYISSLGAGYIGDNGTIGVIFKEATANPGQVIPQDLKVVTLTGEVIDIGDLQSVGWSLTNNQNEKVLGTKGNGFPLILVAAKKNSDWQKPYDPLSLMKNQAAHKMHLPLLLN